MSTVLVVDDSSVDRRLVGVLLEEEPDCSVHYAVNGEDALQQMEQLVPDVVVTDLMMPKIDGLELVEAIKRQYPIVPVILMTSRGNDEIAVKALQKGAANYVPKRRLAKDLRELVRNVLVLSGERQCFQRLVACMSKSEFAFVLNNDRALIPHLVGYMQDSITKTGLWDESERVRVGMALDEALANAFYHGNLELSSDLRENDSQEYEAQVAVRSQQSPYCDRRIFVEAKLSREEAVFVIRDEGPGFDPQSLPDPTDPENLEKASGRGVLLMRSFMDEVNYNEFGNEVTLAKRRCSVATP